jgi:hypothetical protein
MDPDQFISIAMKCGEKQGLAALTGTAHTVFLISEVEVECDINGVDNVVDRIAQGDLSHVGDAFAAIGANEIADGFRQIEAALPHRDEVLMDRVNRMVTGRVGYGYETIKEYVRRAEQGS